MIFRNRPCNGKSRAALSARPYERRSRHRGTFLLACAIALSMGWTAEAQPRRDGDDEAQEPVFFADGYLTLNASNTPTATVLRNIAQYAGIHIAVYGEPENTVSMQFERLRLDDALHRLLGGYNLVLLYREVKDPAPDGPRIELTGVQVHVEPGLNAPTMQFEAGRLVHLRAATNERATQLQQMRERLRAIGATQTSETGAVAAVPDEDAGELLARLKVAAFDKDASVRADAVDELTMLNDERAAGEVLERVLREDPDPEVRASAMSGIEDLDKPPIETVLDAALFDEAPDVRIGAIEIIEDQEWKDARTVDTLSRILDDPNEEIRLAALEVLGELGERSALEAAARSNPHQEVRELAAELLAELKQ